MDMKVVTTKVMAEVCGKMSISMAEEQAAVEKKGMGMNTAMGSAIDSEMKYSHPVSVCRKLSNG